MFHANCLHNLHEISMHIFCEERNYIIYLLSAEVAQRVVKVNYTFVSRGSVDSMALKEL